MASVPTTSANANATAAPVAMGACARLRAWANQVRLLLRKNYLIRRRALSTTCCELLLPVVIVLLLVAVRSAFKTEDFEQSQYVTPDNVLSGDTFDYNRFVYSRGSDAPVPRIVFVPDNAFVRNLTLAVNASLSALCPGPLCVPVTVPYPPPFNTEDELLAYIDDPDYARAWLKPSVALAVVFHQFGRATGVPDELVDANAPNTWDYAVRVNSSAVQATRGDTNPYSVEFNSGYQKFQSSMFSWTQTFVDQYITNAAAAAAHGTGATPAIEYREIAAPMPIAAHTTDRFSTIFSSVIPLFYILTYMYPCARIVRNLVDEKELRIKEGLRMMGLSDSAHWTAWYLTYVIQFGVTALLIMIVGSGSIFKYSDKFIIFIFFWVFGVAMMSFAATLSTLFDRAKTASTMAYLFIFGAYIPTFVLGSNGGDASTYSASAMMWAGLLPPTALGLGATQISFLEGYQLGVTNDTVARLTFNYRFSFALGFLFLDVFVFGLLSWYLDKVLPSEFGNPLEPLFCCRRAYWTDISPLESEAADRAREPAKMQSSIPKAERANEHEEPVSADVRKGLAVQIRGLRKEYSASSSGGAVNVAVDNLNLEMYENQIFCLLGHNGAGKSTTISMLTGLTPISSGDAIVDGLSVRHDMSALRQRIGVCPQHDVLFPTLTVREHLELYSAIKGLSPAEIEPWVQEAIAHVGLTEKEHTYSAALSGGQKRKLSVAIAFTGRSRVVFLDEPTSGMDPYSRRATWETLQRFKAGRVIILTTHFMDEADILGDRIGIMTHGHIQCCGSPLFLKSLYGVGYTVTFTRQHKQPQQPRGADEKKANGNAVAAPDALVTLIRERVPRAEPLTSIGAELSYRMPLDASSSFPALFREVDAHRSTYGVVNYGISVTTLEEVFLKVGGAQSGAGSGSPKHGAAKDADAKIAAGGDEDGAELEMALRAEQELNRSEAEICARHFRALFMKRVHYCKRDRRAAVFQLAIPVVFLILGFGILSAPTSFGSSEYNFDTESYNSPLYTPINSGVASDFMTQLAQFAAAASPSLSTNVQLQPFSASDASTLSGFSDRLLVTRNEFEQSKYIAIYAASEAEAVTWVNSTALDGTTFRTTDPVAVVNGTAGFAGATHRQFLFYLTNVTAYQSLPIAVNIAHNALLRNATGDARATIFTSIHTFPFTAAQKVLVTAGNGFAIAIITVIAFMFIPASYAVFVVRERENKIKHIQTISGVSQLAYWSSTYAWDMVNYLPPFIASIIVVAAFNNASFVGENFGAVVLAFLFYGVAVAPFTYLASFLFASHSTAQTMLILVYFVTGLLFLIISFAMSLIDSTKSAQQSLKYLFRLFPPFCLGDTMVGLATRDLSQALLGTDTKPGPYDMVVSGYNILFLVLEAVAYSALTLVVERVMSSPEPWTHTLCFCLRRSDSGPVGPAFASIVDPAASGVVRVAGAGEADDVDVIAEAGRIDSGACANAAIRIQHLRKEYPAEPAPKLAVRNLSYAVEQGECFGFLGINGAGKTTTLSMLSGEFPSTSGDAYLMNHSVRTEQDKCRRLIGYCPQFDALLDLLTAREHLELFARIKGVREQQIGPMVDTMLRRLTLTEYADRPAGSYSGGNKRKLCVGIALIGNPPIVFLDEPSTGMDPVSRRFMWNFIAQTMKGRAVILTTHSMEECEALCHRLGIMVGGRLRCIGSTQHLKSRFGNGYQLDVNVLDEHAGADATKHFITQNFPGAQLVEFHGTRLKYTLPLTDNRQQPLSLAAVFEAIELNKEQLTIREYSVGQTSLEQIFIDFAKTQNEEKGAIAGMVVAAAGPGGVSQALNPSGSPKNYGSQSEGATHITIAPARTARREDA